MNRNLTPRQEAFCRSMLTTENASEAYRQAGYKSKSRDVSANASRLLAQPHVASRIRQLRDKAAADGVAELSETLVCLSCIARANVSDYLDENGRLDPAKIASAGPELEAFQLVDTQHGQRITIKLRDPIRAIERLAKMLGWDSPDKHTLQDVTFNLALGGG